MMTIKPSDKEEEFFARQAYERKRKMEEENHKLMAKEEKEDQKKRHYMRCPKCGMQLIEMDYKNIKVDKCSECQGIWLDAGELEQVAHLDKPILNKFFSVFKE